MHYACIRNEIEGDCVGYSAVLDAVSALLSPFNRWMNGCLYSQSMSMR